MSDGIGIGSGTQEWIEPQEVVQQETVVEQPVVEESAFTDNTEAYSNTESNEEVGNYWDTSIQENNTGATDEEIASVLYDISTETTTQPGTETTTENKATTESNNNNDNNNDDGNNINDTLSNLNETYNLGIDFDNPENITDEQIELLNRAYTVNTLEENLEATKDSMLEYFDTLGIIDKAYDGVKDILDVGLTKEDVEQYYNNEKEKQDFLTSVIQQGGSITLDDDMTQQLMSISQNTVQTSSDGETLDTSRIKSGETLSFDEVYKLTTGKEYNPELISQVMQSQDAYANVVQLQQNALVFEQTMANSSPKEALEYLNSMAEAKNSSINNEEDKVSGEDLFNQYYSNLFENYSDTLSQSENRIGLTCSGISVQDGYLWQEMSFPEGSDDAYKDMITQSEFLYKKEDENGNIKYYKVVNIEDEHEVKSNITGKDETYELSGFAAKEDDPTYANNPLEMFYKTNDLIKENTLHLEEVKKEYNSNINNSKGNENIESNEDNEGNENGESNETNKNVFDTILEEYPKMYEEAFGDNILLDKLQSYEKDMDSYSQKISQVASISCFAASFIPGVQLGAIPLLAAGTDNAIDLANLATNKTDNELGQWAINTGLEAGMLMVGMGINNYASNQANSFVANKIAKGSEFIMNHAAGVESFVEYGIDNAASVAWDLGKGVLTGEFTNPDGTFNSDALLSTVVSDLIFNTADLRNGMSLYRSLNSGEAIDIGDGVKFQIDSKTGDVKYTYDNGSGVEIKNGVATYIRADGTTADLTFDSSTKTWTLPDGNEFDLNNGKTVEYSSYNAGSVSKGASSSVVSAKGYNQDNQVNANRVNTLSNTQLEPNKSYTVNANQNPEINIGTTTINLEQFELSDGNSIVIGRGSDCDLQVEDPYVSGKHVRVTKVGNEYQIEDLGSKNGTIVNSGSWIANTDELCRVAGNNGKPVSNTYIKNNELARETIIEGITSGRSTASVDDYVKTMNEAHIQACKGNGLYYTDSNGRVLSEAELNPGVQRTNAMRNGRATEAMEAAKIAEKNGYKYDPSFNKLELEGIDSNGSPVCYTDGNGKYYHFYPDGSYLDQYNQQLYRTHCEIINGIDDFNKGQITEDQLITKIAEHYQYGANARPYEHINNSLYMNEVNTYLQLAGLPKMTQGEYLDHVAQRLQPVDFTDYFKQYYSSNKINPDNPEVDVKPSNDIDNKPGDSGQKKGIIASIFNKFLGKKDNNIDINDMNVDDNTGWLDSIEARNNDSNVATFYNSGRFIQTLGEKTALLPDCRYEVVEGTHVRLGDTDLALDDLGLTVGESMVVGRGRGISLNIDVDNKISREHLEVVKTNQGYSIRDLNSSNGTSVNFEPLQLIHREGSVSVHKNISSSTYEKLFGTSDGKVHSNSNQQENGDCYYLSSFNALYDNPSSRNTIYGCFKEVTDGNGGKSVKVQLPNGKMEYDYDAVLREVNKNPEQYSGSTDGLKVLEYVYGEERYNKAVDILTKKCKLTSDEYTKEIAKLLETSGIRTVSQLGDSIKFREGGWSKEVMSMFGYKTQEYYKPKDMIKSLSELENWKNNVYTIGTKQTPSGGGDDKFWYRDLDLAGNHMYMLQPRVENGEIVVDLRNPWHSSDISCTLTLGEIKKLKCFDYLGVTRVS